jgi:hypothetical protein
MVPSEEGTREYINEDGMLVVEHAYVSEKTANYTYLFADIEDEVSRQEHVEDEEYGFEYLR